MKGTSDPGKRRKPYEPSATDIRRECERIQAKWSERERNRRAGQVPRSTWSPPSVDWSAVTDAVSESQSDVPAVSSRSDGLW
jgi:hypothetical protein